MSPARLKRRFPVKVWQGKVALGVTQLGYDDWLLQQASVLGLDAPAGVGRGARAIAVLELFVGRYRHQVQRDEPIAEGDAVEDLVDLWRQAHRILGNEGT